MCIYFVIETVQDILSDIRSSYLSPADYEIDTGIDISKAGFRPDQGRVIIIVKDEYTSRQISDFVASLEYDYDYDTYGPAANTKFTDSEGWCDTKRGL